MRHLSGHCLLYLALAVLPACVGSVSLPHGRDRSVVSDDANVALRGTPPPAWHIERNRHNLCPQRRPVPNIVDCRGLKWTRDDLMTAWYFHSDGWLGDGNTTYRSAEPEGEGGYQCTYNLAGLLIIAGPARGTYDYVRPDASLPRHRDRDLRPHQRWPEAYENPDRTRIYDGEDCGTPHGG